MGVNFYLRKAHYSKCPHCGQSVDEPEQVHIGKSSRGWCFSLHAIEGFALSLKEWEPHFQGGRIFSEEGEEIPYKKMMDIILNRWMEKLPDFPMMHIGNPNRVQYHDLQEMLDANQAILGPNNLFRHKSSKVTGGEEPWDLVHGDFS